MGDLIPSSNISLESRSRILPNGGLENPPVEEIESVTYDTEWSKIQSDEKRYGGREKTIRHNEERVIINVMRCTIRNVVNHRINK